MRLRPAAAFTIMLLAASTTSNAADDASARAQQVIDRGLAFLKTQQKPDGGWQGEKDPPAISAIVLRAFVRDGEHFNSKTDFVARGYDKLLTYQVESGGIYKDLLANYNTSIAVSALAAANDPKFDDAKNRATQYLKSLQWSEDTRPEYAGEGETNTGQQVVKDTNDPFYGGWGYGGRSRGAGRPDLSNAQLALDALKDAGVPSTDPAFQRAVVFASRLQNLSETNPQGWASSDGGFVYGPSADRKGEGMAGEYTTPDGRRMIRSYGSMTYAGLKSFIYAGLSKDDPRVRAAWNWITTNWTLDENPGMGAADPKNAQNGLFYYYHTLARALNEYDEPTIVTPDGKQVDWRVALVEKLASLQKPDGSFAGEKKWMEGNPILVTAYVVNALEDVQKDLQEHPAK